MSPALINHPQSYGHLAICGFIAIKSLGIPLPGETTLIAVALHAGTSHRLNIALIAAVAVGTAIVGYRLGSRGGMRLIRRHGRRAGLTPQRLNVGRYLSDQHGGKVAAYGRFVPGLRTFATYPYESGPAGALLVTR